MGLNKGMYSSNTDDWATPQWLFDKLNRQYNFEIDVCATKENAKCHKYYTIEQDGLRQRWEGRCWCNPPYGRKIGLWLEKAYKSSLWGASVVCLIPARTDTQWWNNWAVKGDIEYIKGRLKFGNSQNSAPFASAIIKYRPLIPHYGIFPDFDIEHEINIWGVDRISTMAPWLLPYVYRNREVINTNIN
jgi:phage N-6-adenine-methyltransferase